MMVPQQWLELAPKPRALQNGDRWNVFLSYRSVNRTWVLNLYDVLTQAGHKVFLDQYQLKGGDQLITTLEDALETSQAGILVWSSRTADSDWVRREYQAMERFAESKPGFQFVPIRLEACKLPVFASGRVFYDFASYPDGPNGGELLRLLHAVCGQALSPKAVQFANELDESSMVEATRIDAAVKNGLYQRIIQLYEAGGLPWQVSAGLGSKAAEGLARLGRKEEACTMLEKIMAQFPKAIRPKQLMALALARRGNEGDLDRAQELLGELYVSGQRDPETLGIYARTWMDRYERSKDTADLLQSRDIYAEAFGNSPDDYYTGINAAAKSVLLGGEKDLEKAREYATQVQQLVGTGEIPGDYWKTATVAEVFLIQGKYTEAASMYEKAVKGARSEKGSHRSSLTQAERLMKKLPVPEAERSKIVSVFNLNEV